MLTALVLICSISSTPNLQYCTQANARVVMRVPAEFASPVTCALHGQSYLAETALGRSLGEDDRVKVACVRRETVDKSIATLPFE
ncbi:MAG TPA: hypothetical protein VFE34_11945 [Dongiaceae bacterium]|nr:hypothetical protein [Dongiaceae bacterium]